MKIVTPSGEKLHENRFVYTFSHNTKHKIFGPYADETEAREAFQKVYGYWPGECLSTLPYALDTRPNL